MDSLIFGQSVVRLTTRRQVVDWTHLEQSMTLKICDDLEHALGQIIRASFFHLLNINSNVAFNCQYILLFPKKM